GADLPPAGSLDRQDRPVAAQHRGGGGRRLARLRRPPRPGAEPDRGLSLPARPPAASGSLDRTPDGGGVPAALPGARPFAVAAALPQGPSRDRFPVAHFCTQGLKGCTSGPLEPPWGPSYL